MKQDQVHHLHFVEEVVVVAEIELVVALMEAVVHFEVKVAKRKKSYLVEDFQTKVVPVVDLVVARIPHAHDFRLPKERVQEQPTKGAWYIIEEEISV